MKVKKLFILAAMLIEDHLTMNIPDANVAGDLLKLFFLHGKFYKPEIVMNHVIELM